MNFSTKILFIVGPTAGGKSTFINLFKEYVVNLGIYKNSNIHFFNDYSLLSELFAEDDIRENKGLKRLYSERCEQLYGVTNSDVFEVVNARLSQQILNSFTEFSKFPNDHLIISELSRSGKSAYRKFFCRFPIILLKRSRIICLAVKFDETFYRNKYRQTYSLPDKNLVEMNSGDDWEESTKAKKTDVITFAGVEVPCLVVDNNQRWPVINANAKEVKEKLHPAIDFLFKTRETE